MELTINITDKCNLRCKYCYQGNHTGKNTITDKLIGDILEFIRDKLNYFDEDTLKIVYIGGEALIAFAQMKQITEMLELKFPNINKKYSITTNGTILNDEIINFLKEYSINTAISIDGNKESHDVNRVDASGGGTFDKVISNVERLLSEKINIAARMTVSPNNVENLADNVVSLYNKGIKLFNIVCDFLVEWSGKEISLLKEQYIKLETWYLEHNESVSLSCFDGRYLSLLTRKDLFCKAGIGSHYTLAFNGEIYPCNYVANDKEFKLGDCAKIMKPLDVHSKYQGYMALQQNKCIECKTKEFCHGRKCHFLNYTINGTFNNVSNFMCYHELFIYERLRKQLSILKGRNSDYIRELLQYIQDNNLENNTFKEMKYFNEI